MIPRISDFNERPIKPSLGQNQGGGGGGGGYRSLMNTFTSATGENQQQIMDMSESQFKKRLNVPEHDEHQKINMLDSVHTRNTNSFV